MHADFPGAQGKEETPRPAASPIIGACALQAETTSETDRPRAPNSRRIMRRCCFAWLHSLQTRPRKTLEFAYETFEISFLIFSDFVQIERAR
jgi:hypothetical protein